MRYRSATTALLLLLFAVAWLPGAPSAQESNPTTTELVTRYLTQDIFLRPGVGFKKVSLGFSFLQVAQIWGKPDAAFAKGSTDEVWLYRVAEHSEILVTGSGTVTSIEVRGKANSPFITTEGAQMGMPLYQITTIYGRSAEEQAQQVVYENRGIRFGFSQGQLVSMEVFPPG